MNLKKDKKPLILCITENEYKAIKRRFTVTNSEEYNSIIIEHGFLSNKPFSLSRLSEMGSRGRDSISHKLPLLLKYLKPSLVVELGICFGLKDDFKIQDVAICSYSVDYELAKINEKTNEHRTRTTQSDASIHAKLINFSLNTEFPFKVHNAIYACGDKIVNSQEFKNELKNSIPDAICGDMESYILGVCCESEKIPWTVIKGSSDDGVNKGDEYQLKAAENATIFFESFITKSSNIEGYFENEFEVNFKRSINFDLISKEIFNNNILEIQHVNNSRSSYQIHKHPEMSGAWVIVYISKAHSIPDIIRAVIRNGSSLSRIDVCIATKNEITPYYIKQYISLALNLGINNFFIADIGKFIFKRIVEKNTAASLISPPVNYVDQIVYRQDDSSTEGSKYARTFIYGSDKNSSNVKPISIILGQGGIGKTTFCLSLANMINNVARTDKRMFLITKTDILNNFSGETIDSISKLYMEYTRNRSGQSRPISHETFSLSLSCGSIILMIDGIDEIESALGDKFKMEPFLASIQDLNESLESCRVLITSRDSYSSRYLGIENSEVLYIKGFSASDIKAYTMHDTPQVKKRIIEFSHKIKNNDELVNPYLLHVVRQFHFNDSKENWESQEIATTRLDINIPFDYCLARAFMREIEKQSLHISIDDYYDLLNEIVIESNNRMGEEEFEYYIEFYLQRNGTTLPPRREPYLKFFLLREENGFTSVSHMEYVAHIMLNKLYGIFTNNGHIDESHIRIIRSLLGGPKSESYGLRGRLSSRLVGKDFPELSFEKILKEALNGVKRNGADITTQRAVHELHLLAFDYWNPKSSVERRKLLEKLHNKDSIEGMCILSDCPAIDFSDCVVRNSIFRHFRGLFNCKINEGTRFINCEFMDCSGNFKRENIRSETFIECKLDDGMRHLLYAGDDKRIETSVKFKSDVKQVLKSMRQGLGFLPTSINKIKSQSNLVSGKSYEEFLRIMCESKVLESHRELFSVVKAAELDAIALCEEGHAQGAISGLIKSLCGT